MNNVPCPDCGAPTEPGERFCGNCGAALARPPDTVTPAAPPPPTPAPRPRKWLRVLLVVVLAAVLAAVIGTAAQEFLLSRRPPVPSPPVPSPTLPSTAPPQAAPMAIYAVQTSRFLGSGRWAWEIHLEGDPAALDMVERVIYQLHPSFDPPVRISTDRLSGFQLATEGWGSFPVPVTAWLKDGSTLTWEVQLVFNY